MVDLSSNIGRASNESVGETYVRHVEHRFKACGRGDELRVSQQPMIAATYLESAVDEDIRTLFKIAGKFFWRHILKILRCYRVGDKSGGVVNYRTAERFEGGKAAILAWPRERTLFHLIKAKHENLGTRKVLSVVA